MNTIECDIVPNNYIQMKLIGCATIIEEAETFLPQNMSVQIIDFGLHVKYEDLNRRLQQMIDSTPENIKYIILGYGLCAKAVIGLRSKASILIIPRVDDCVALFYGSQNRYRELLKEQPGTYYLTKGWLKAESSLFNELELWKKRYGEQKAQKILQATLKNYRRICFIETGHTDIDKYRRQAQELALRFALQFQSIRCVNNLLYRLIHGPWNEKEFVIIHPGETVQLHHFMYQ